MGRGKVTKLFPRELMGVTFESNISANLREMGRVLSEQALRSAARAGALVFYNEMRLRAPVASGQLRDSIYHWHDYLYSTPTRQIYRIGPNKAKAPHWYVVEYGHWRVNAIVNGRPTKQRLKVPVWEPANPYIRPTYDGKVNAALEAAKKRLAERTIEVMREVAAA